MRRLAVLDVGKTNVKLAVLDEQGVVLWERRRSNRVLDAPPYPHYDVEGIWHWLLSELGEAAGRYPVDAIVTTAHGACAALVSDSALALPVLDYEHPAPEQFSADYAALCDSFALTYSPSLPAGLNLGRQLYWQAKTFAQEFAQARQILLYPQYWSWRLSGVAAAEVTSLGCHTDLWRPESGVFSGLATEMGWDKLFPPLRPAWQALASLLPEIAAQTGLSPQCQIINGIHDSNASLLRHLLSRRPPGEPFSVVSTGTWVIIAAVGASLTALDGERDMLANVDALGRPVACARFMGGREFAALNDPPAASCTPADIAAIVERGVFALPAFADAGGPFIGHRGRLLGGTAGDGGERYALASLYIALLTDYCLSALGAKGEIVIEGSFNSNAHYAALLAALRPRQQVWLSSDAAGTVGGAYLLGNWGNAAPATACAAVAAYRECDLLDYRERWLQYCSIAS
jgi:sugar (pentulose or hexulose) kinase